MKLISSERPNFVVARIEMAEEESVNNSELCNRTLNEIDVFYEKLEEMMSRFVRENKDAVRDFASHGHVGDNLKFDNMISKSAIMKVVFLI
ncbi:MAG: hypothetical protein GWN00_23815 [Aliifodinibius sp.]|nr:hypothetical protein [Fodinibius sp.]NIY27720.1 hypothetical protein [Fodinibius sp.]